MSRKDLLQMLASFPAPSAVLDITRTPINSGVRQKQRRLDMFCAPYLQQIRSASLR